MQIAFLWKEKVGQQQAVFTYHFFYTIVDLETHYPLANEKPLFDGLFMLGLLGMTYSTLIGILFRQLTEALLKNIIFPVIKVPDLLKTV